MKRSNMSFGIATFTLDSGAVCVSDKMGNRSARYARMPTKSWSVRLRKRKPAFAEPTADSLRTICRAVPSGTTGIGLPAVGLAEAGGEGGIRIASDPTTEKPDDKGL